MELDDMKAAWRALDQRLDAQAKLSLHTFTESKLDRMRRGLRPLAWGQALQIGVGTLVAIWAGSFWVAHRDVPHLLVAGLTVHAAGISMIAAGALMLVRIAHIDYSAPVLGIQQQLARLRQAYVRGGLAVGLPWWLLWIPFLMVYFKSAFGADLYANAPSAIWIGSACGVVGLLATLGFVHWSGKRPHLAKRLQDSAAGDSIDRAQACLDEIARFKSE